MRQTLDGQRPRAPSEQPAGPSREEIFASLQAYIRAQDRPSGLITALGLPGWLMLAPVVMTATYFLLRALVEPSGPQGIIIVYAFFLGAIAFALWGQEHRRLAYASASWKPGPIPRKCKHSRAGSRCPRGGISIVTRSCAASGSGRQTHPRGARSSKLWRRPSSGVGDAALTFLPSPPAGSPRAGTSRRRCRRRRRKSGAGRRARAASPAPSRSAADWT